MRVFFAPGGILAGGSSFTSKAWPVALRLAPRPLLRKKGSCTVVIYLREENV